MGKLQQQPQWAEVTDQNVKDIRDINETLNRLEHNHISHLEKDMEKQSKLLDKLDMRLWAILMLLVVGIVVPALIKGIM